MPLSSGEIVQIEELYRRMGRRSERIHLQGHPILVDSLDPLSLRMKDLPASSIWKLRSDRLVRIRLRNGFSISTTPEHPFFVLSNLGLIAPKRADELEVGSYVAIPAVLRSRPLSLAQLKAKILELLSRRDYYLVHLEERFRDKLRAKILEMGAKGLWVRAGSMMGYRSFLEGVHSGRYSLQDLLKIAEEMGISRRELYDGIRLLLCRSSIKRYGRHSKPIRMPHTYKEFKAMAYALGLIFGDGTYRASLVNSNLLVISRYLLSIRTSFGVTGRSMKTSTAFKVDHRGGLSLIKFLEDAFDYQARKKGRDLRIPSPITMMPKGLIIEFLRGLFDADGRVEFGRRAVSILSASEAFADQLAILLLRFKINAVKGRMGNYLVLRITGGNARSFERRIGFTLPYKSAALRRLSRASALNKITDIVPLRGEELRAIRIAVGLPGVLEAIPYYAKYEDGREPIGRELLARIVDLFRRALDSGKGLDLRLQVLSSTRQGSGIKEMMDRTSLSAREVNGILRSLARDGLVEERDGTYRITGEGEEVARIWEALRRGQGDEKAIIGRILELWRSLAGDVKFVKVVGKDLIQGPFDVYDLTVPGTHTFVANGVIVHNTTMTDSLLAAAGLLSPSVAGTALALDYMEEEQKRQMTIKAANVSLYHEFEGKPYVINLIDTPGHVDFSGKVTRSLRAIDGAVVVVDAVEEVMVQTETVTRQALEERVRPILYINKIDRLIKELKLTPEQIQDKIGRIIGEFNGLIEFYAEPEFRDSWKVSFATNTVAMGSAKDRWGFTADMALRKGIKFADVVDAYANDKVDELVRQVPLHEAILDMVVDAMPPPPMAQRYRIPRIWHGSIESEVGQAMLNCDDDGPTVMMVTNLVVDPQAGVVATGRLFSGSVREGDMLYLIGARTQQRVQQVAIFMGPYREIVGSLSAGNIPALLGLDAARSGETVASIRDVAPFEALRYVTEPVVTMAVEPKRSSELPKLVDVLKRLSLEDPNLVVTINEETGEYLMSGMGTLHLEIATTLIQKKGLEIVTSRPIVIYRESVRRPAGPFEGRSPNRHNRIKILVEPLSEDIVSMIKSGEINDYMDRHALAKVLREKGWPAEEAGGVWSVDEGGNMLVEVTKGAQFLQEAKDMIIAGYRWGLKEGPLAYEQIRGVKVKVVDVQLHEDPVHRGPAQIMPMTRRAFFAGFLSADPALLEPIQRITVKVPPDLLGAVTSVISQRRGKILSVEQRGHLNYVIAELPTAETFDLSEVMRSATAGRAFWGLEFSHWAPVPQSMFLQVVQEIRRRKGLPPEPHKPQEFLE